MAHTTPDTIAGPLDRIPRERTHLLPALLAMHARDGYLPEAALRAVARHVHVPESEVYGVATSYTELRLSPPPKRSIAVCTGLSCILNGARDLARSLAAADGGVEIEETACRFRCNEAPVASVRDAYVARASANAVLEAANGATPEPRARPTPSPRDGEVRRLLARCGRVDPSSIDDALAHGAYGALRRAQTLTPDAIVQIVEESGLHGRGGAYFPAAAKWKSARAHPAPRYLVVNAEEGEPGVFKDRHLIENDPHVLVEGMLIAARAVEAGAVYVYVNGEATLAAGRLHTAIEQARAKQLVPAGLRIEVRRGAGGYVCGEESVILNSIEGERAVPRLRPPFPVESGLFGRPTVINNVETLCNLPAIIREGPVAFRAAGTPGHPGTKLACLSGAFRVPGIAEVPLGTPLRHIVDVIGGGARPGSTLRAVLCGGPSGTLLPPALWDAPFAPGLLDASGASPGAGGVVAIDDAMSIAAVVRHLTAYNAAESCGKCTPCREGTPRMVEELDRPAEGMTGRLDVLAEAVAAASLCGLGQMAPLPYLSARRYFPDEIDGGRP